MKKYYLVYLVFLSLLILGCKKNEINYSFAGAVKDGTTNAPLKNVSVIIQQKLASGNLSLNDFIPAGSAETNEIGQYKITFPRQKATHFSVNLNLNGYFKSETIISSSNMSAKEQNLLYFNLDPIATVVINIKNAFPDEKDELKLIFRNFREGCENCAENKTYLFYEGVDTIVKYETTGNKYARFIYVDVKAGYSKEDSVFATPFDTTYYTIEY